jgi:hypothetical protein
MKRIAAGIVLMATVCAAQAESLKDGYIACLSEDYLDQFNQALVSNDNKGMEFLYNKGVCVPTSSKFSISVLDRGFMVTKFRVYVGDDAAVLYTASEAIGR